MKKTKLYKIFKCFTAWELNDLQQFVDSPFFNKREDVNILLKYLILKEKKINSIFDSEEAFELMYPNKKFDDTQFRLVCSYLFKLVESYLALSEVRNNEAFLKIQLAKAYRKRNIDNHFLKAFKDSERILEKKVYRNQDYWSQTFDAQTEYFNFLTNQRRSQPEVLQKVIDTLEIYILSVVVRQLCTIITEETVASIVYNKELADIVFNYIDTHPKYLEVPSIAVYYYYYQAVRFPDSGYFTKMFELIKNNQSKFPDNEIRVIYFLAGNYCVQRINAGAAKYRKAYWDLNTVGLEHGILLKNGVISRFFFKNMVVAALKMKDGEKAEKFVNDYKLSLEYRFRESTCNLCYGRIRYFQGNYDEAMVYLAQFISTDVLFTLDAKFTSIKMLYELGEIEVLDSQLKSMDTYLERKKTFFAQHWFLYYKQFVKLIYKLLKLSVLRKDAFQKLKDEILLIKVSEEREWFLKQLNEGGGKNTRQVSAYK